MVQGSLRDEYGAETILREFARWTGNKKTAFRDYMPILYRVSIKSPPSLTKLNIN